MKYIIVILWNILITNPIYGMSVPDDPNSAVAWYEKMGKGVEKWAKYPERNLQIRNLGDYLFKFGQRMPDHPDIRWQHVYQEAQTALLSVPGHAQYFADEIERRQNEVWKDPLVAGGRGSYNSDRAYYFGVIAHLPSPEAIKILGNFLSDDKDTPSERISPNSDYGPNAPANSLYSTYTLIDIGLRDAPVSPKQRDDDQDQILAKTRAWWKEIEGGKRTFSFKGQNVEYRFKPDGTWETLSMANPPDDGPGRPQAGPTRPARRPATDQREPRLSIQVTIIPWLLAFGTFVLATACWWAMRKKP